MAKAVKISPVVPPISDQEKKVLDLLVDVYVDVVINHGKNKKNNRLDSGSVGN
jgi:hypothetical protein